MLEIVVGKQKELVNLLQNISERFWYISERTDGNPFVNIIRSGWIWRFLNVQYRTELLEDETNVLVLYKTELYDVQYWQFLTYKVTPMILAICPVVGITGNWLLLTIFVTHKKTRTLANSMLINLTVVDFISLVVNVLLDCLRVIVLLKFSFSGSKHFYIFTYLLLAVSANSMAIISVQRFVAVRQLPSRVWCLQSQKTKYILTAIVWCIGLILSVPHGVSISRHDTCDAVSLENASTMLTVDFITLCVVPLLITAVFSGLTAYRIRRSAREIPGEATGQQQFQHSRMVPSRLLFALTFLFVVSYAPFYLFSLLIYANGFSLSFRGTHLISLITHHLKFVNCCLHPIVLFILSKRYKVYIKRYCGQRKVQRATKSGSRIETTL